MLKFREKYSPDELRTMFRKFKNLPAAEILFELIEQQLLDSANIMANLGSTMDEIRFEQGRTHALNLLMSKIDDLSRESKEKI